uniref:Transposase n=1 Tax=Klebsiella pneumoniae TaxID=573 RepID=A0A2P1BN83_KLEPN|nr:hypothetical protein [Klebsiella pneumoniae]
MGTVTAPEAEYARLRSPESGRNGPLRAARRKTMTKLNKSGHLARAA